MTAPRSKSNTLLFSIALNGYQSLYRRHFDSHRLYAESHGYDYVCVAKPSSTPLRLECAWLKVALMIEALQQAYEWVVFVDADTRISSLTPPIESVQLHNKSLYMVKGFSGRLNSGVLIVHNKPSSLQFFQTVLANAEQPLPEEDDVGWGENGHIIHFAKHNSAVHFLDSRWNNNSDLHLRDYIRHYSRGPLYRHYRPTRLGKLAFAVTHYRLALCSRARFLLKKIKADNTDRSFHSDLDELLQKVLRHYPEFAYKNTNSDVGAIPCGD